MTEVLSGQESLRYSRHLLLKQISETGQIKLKNAHVVVVGAGGLGCPASLYLAAAGVGRLTIIDPDTIEVSNLQRQVLYKTNHQGRGKAQMASQQLQALNTQITVTAVAKKVQSADFIQRLADVDLVLDCTDNADSRFFINRCCQQTQTSLITAAAIRAEGQFMFFNFKQNTSPCYECVFAHTDSAEQQDSCQNSGVLGPLLGIMGSLQALEAIKYLTEQKDLYSSRLLTFDGWHMQFNSFCLTADPECPVCRSK